MPLDEDFLYNWPPLEEFSVRLGIISDLLDSHHVRLPGDELTFPLIDYLKEADSK